MMTKTEKKKALISKIEGIRATIDGIEWRRLSQPNRRHPSREFVQRHYIFQIQNCQARLDRLGKKNEKKLPITLNVISLKTFRDRNPGT